MSRKCIVVVKHDQFIETAQYIGPFDTYDEAMVQVENLKPEDDWHIVYLEDPAEEVETDEDTEEAKDAAWDPLQDK